MKIRFMPEAQAQARRAADWWRANRLAAPKLFENELAGALEQLAEAPASGSPHPHRKIQGARRLLLRATRYHIYYLHDTSRDEIIILSIWSAVRGRGPRLGPVR